MVEFARRDPRVTEVLVVDDGSIDETPELAGAAGAGYPVETFRRRAEGARVFCVTASQLRGVRVAIMLARNDAALASAAVRCSKRGLASNPDQ